ncbi:MAG: DUF3568 family protein [Gemmatimonadota bacterium]
MASGMRAITRSMILVLTAGLSGCLLAAGAGAGGAVFFSGHTAEAIVERSVADMANVAERVLSEEQVAISTTSSEDSGATRTYEGRKGDLDVTVIVERVTGGAKVRVSVRRGTTSWDDDYAKELLAKIIG